MNIRLEKIMKKQIQDLEIIFDKAKQLFQNVSKCKMEEDKICAVDIYTNYERYFEYPKYQISPNWTEENKFNITLSYGVAGWSNCAGIFTNITIDDVFLFFKLIENSCTKVIE
jgi:hypothetical protein